MIWWLFTGLICLCFFVCLFTLYVLILCVSVHLKLFCFILESWTTASWCGVLPDNWINAFSIKKLCWDMEMGQERNCKLNEQSVMCMMTVSWFPVKFKHYLKSWCWSLTKAKYQLIISHFFKCIHMRQQFPWHVWSVFIWAGVIIWNYVNPKLSQFIIIIEEPRKKFFNVLPHICTHCGMWSPPHDDHRKLVQPFYVTKMPLYQECLMYQIHSQQWMLV